MAVKKQWNKIISIKFFKENIELPQYEIKCPTYGRKPDIEISGQFVTDDLLPAFNVKIKNLYMDAPSGTDINMQIKAGYEGSLQTFTGSLLSMINETPSPEGITTFQCVLGSMINYNDVNVSINLIKNYSLYEAAQKIADALGLTLLIDTELITAMSGEPLEFTGKAKEAISVLKQRFVEKHIMITIRDQKLCVWSTDTRQNFINYDLDYLSSPPQRTAGGDGSVWNDISAPWIPALRPGDTLTYKSNSYRLNYHAVSEKRQKLVTTTVQFHFSTVGNINQMTVSGYGVN